MHVDHLGLPQGRGRARRSIPPQPGDGDGKTGAQAPAVTCSALAATNNWAPFQWEQVTSAEGNPGGNVDAPGSPTGLAGMGCTPTQCYRWARLAEAVLELVPAPTARHQVAHSRVMTQIGAAAHAAGYRLLPWVAVVTDSAVPGSEKRPVILVPRYSRKSSTRRLPDLTPAALWRECRWRVLRFCQATFLCLLIQWPQSTKGAQR